MANINLSFTVVNTGAVKGASQFTSFEVHATGCKDLNGLVRANRAEGSDLTELPGGFWVEEALNVAAAVKQALGDPKDSGDLAGMGYLPKDFKVCSCCGIKRMAAAGRVPAGYTGLPATEGEVVVEGEALTEALQQLAEDAAVEEIFARIDRSEVR